MKTQPTETNPNIHLTFREKVGIGALGALVVAGGFAGLESLNGQSDNHLQKEQANAVEATTQVLNTEVILKGGAKVRLTPEALNGTPKDGLPNNVATTIPVGEQWVVKEPLTGTSGGWIAFTKPGVNTSAFHSIKDRAAETVWVDLGALQSQGYAYLDPYKGEPSGGVAAQVLENGSIQTKGADDPTLATATQSVDPNAVNQRVA